MLHKTKSQVKKKDVKKIKKESRKNTKKGSVKKQSVKKRSIKKRSIKKRSIKKDSVKKYKKRSVKKYKKRSIKKKYSKKQFGGQTFDNQIAVGTAFRVLYDRKPEKSDELILKENDIIYVIYSPIGDWWFGLSRIAVEKALSKKKKEDIHQVIIELINFLYKNPSEIKPSLFGNLLGWFPINYVKLYTPKKSLLTSILTIFDKKQIGDIELKSPVANILETYTLSPSPTSKFPPFVERQLKNIPKRK